MSNIENLEFVLSSSPARIAQEPAFRAVQYDRLADLNYAKYDITGNEDDLEATRFAGQAAIATGIQASQIAPPDESTVGQWWALQGSRLSKQYNRFGQDKDLDDAVQAYEEALQALSPESGLRPVVLINQANSLCTRYEVSGSPADINDAIAKAEASLASGNERTVMQLNDVSTIYLTRFEQGDTIKDLENAAKLAREAVDGSTEDDPRLPRRLLNLANVHVTHFKRCNDIEHLGGAITVLQRANEISRSSHSTDKLHVLWKLAHALYTRYCYENDSSDLHDAIRNAREALELGQERRSAHIDAEACRPIEGVIDEWIEEARELGGPEEDGKINTV
ncbi:hypothetical protein GQ44DRAFT_452198 [Phaeosphaeriaceae sp. PMI808]|nr:hypothetical protein GQ44DRAFT_452198 [Phaeosphaeriaceae sp. PMI808]